MYAIRSYYGLVAAVIAIAIQGTVAFTLEPFVVVWGGILLPTFLAWMTFVTALYALTGNRYGAYGLSRITSYNVCYTKLLRGDTIAEGRIHRHGSAPNLFVAGDFATGEGTVAHAIGDGRRAAGRALAALGEPATIFVRPNRAEAVPVSGIHFSYNFV